MNDDLLKYLKNPFKEHSMPFKSIKFACEKMP
jgi:hypothetical protein